MRLNPFCMMLSAQARFVHGINGKSVDFTRIIAETGIADRRIDALLDTAAVGIQRTPLFGDDYVACTLCAWPPLERVPGPSSHGTVLVHKVLSGSLAAAEGWFGFGEVGRGGAVPVRADGEVRSGESHAVSLEFEIGCARGTAAPQPMAAVNAYQW